MSKTTEECGGEAFPGAFGCGMTLRDYFAAAALRGHIASDTEEFSCNEEKHAAYAYQVADAMLAARGEIES